jgi:hypothetical protein
MNELYCFNLARSKRCFKLKGGKRMNNRRWRFLSIFITTALMFSSLAGINLHTARADVQNTQVTPYPREAGKNASYRVGTNINAALNSGTDSISVIFPKETRIESMISSANISVNPKRLNRADFELDYTRGTINLLAPLQKGDRVTASYRYDPGVAYTGLPRSVKFYDNTFAAGDIRRGNGVLDPGEWIYEDRTNNNKLAVGDRRLCVVVAPGNVYRAGSLVQIGDADLIAAGGNELGPLTNYPVSNLKFVDVDDNGIYSENDWLIDDRDNNDLLSVGDRVITGYLWYVAGMVVNQTDLDRFNPTNLAAQIGASFAPLAGTLRHAENVNKNNQFDEGEYIYNDADANNRVSAGDTRFTWVYSNTMIYPRLSVVLAADKDVGTTLVAFINNAPTRQETTYNPGIFPLNYFKTIYSHVGAAAALVEPGNLRLSPAQRAVFNPMVGNVAANDPDAGQTLFQFNTNEKYAGFNPLAYSQDDPIYRDLDNTATVTEGDLRLTDFSIWVDNTHILYTAGSTVRKGEYDLGLALSDLDVLAIKHTESGVPNAQFDPGELIYDDVDANNRVSAGDVRYDFNGIQSANITVPAAYPDAGLTLTRGWTDITNEVLISYANGGERQLQLNNKPVVRPVVPISNDVNHRLTPLTIPGGDMRGKGKFYYVITAVSDIVGESDTWEERMVDFISGSTTNAVKIEWSPVPNASKYRIYRTPNQGTYEETSLIAQVMAPTTHYIDLGGEALNGMPPSIYSSSFTVLTLNRTDPVTGTSSDRRLVEFDLSDYKLDLASGNITFRRPLKSLDTIVADYDRGIKVTNESVMFQAIQGRGKLRNGEVLDPNIYGEELYPVKLHRISAANPNDPTLLVRGVDYEFEDENRNKIEGLKKGEITFFIQLLQTDIVRAEYTHRRQVRGDMIKVATGNETTVRTSEGSIIAHTDIIMKGRTLSSAPVINVMNSDKGPVVTFTTPVNVKPNPANKLNVTPDSPRDLNITFSLQIGIRNPEKAGTYQVFMRTSKEQTEILSNPYEIIAGEEGQQLIKLTRDQQVEAGSSIALATTVQDELGNNVPNVNVVYTTIKSPDGLAKLDKTSFVTDSSGKAVAMLTTSPNPGENVVEARIAGTNRSVLFTITGLSSSPISQITITPDTAIMTPRSTRQFRATGLDAQGNTVPNVTFNWSVDPANLGTIDQNGNFTSSDAVGSGMIHAEAYGIRGTAVVTISSGPTEEIATIQIDPTSATVAVNQSRQFTAIARDQNNQIIPGVSFNWTITPADLGVISANGLFTASRKGTGVVIASAGGKQAIAAVTVSDNIGRIEINPSSATVKRNETVQFYAMVYDSNNQIITVPVTWAVTGGIGIITQTGIFTATSPGNGQVTATAGSVQSSVPVMVTDQMPGDTEGPDIQITYPTPNQSTADSNIIVRGTVRDPSGIKQVTVNNALATYDPINHTFASQPLMLNAGSNTITVNAEDTLGNISTKTVQVVKASSTIIKLAIGSSFAGVTRDGQMQMMRLDVAPFLQSGRTMVPLRFIAEAFGAEVKWHADPSGTGDGGIEIILMKANGTRIVIKMHTTSKTVIIETYAPGSYQAQTTRYEMEVKPFVVKPQGRTVVPIRFIAEGFGAEVQWEASTQEITITMMP